MYQSITTENAFQNWMNIWLQEIEKKIKELQAACEEMKKEINNRQLEAKTLKEDVEDTKRGNVLEAKELEKSQDEMEKLKVRFNKRIQNKVYCPITTDHCFWDFANSYMLLCVHAVVYLYFLFCLSQTLSCMLPGFCLWISCPVFTKLAWMMLCIKIRVPDNLIKDGSL